MNKTYYFIDLHYSYYNREYFLTYDSAKKAFDEQFKKLDYSNYYYRFELIKETYTETGVLLERKVLIHKRRQLLDYELE